MNVWQFVSRPDPRPWPAIINAPAEHGSPYVYRVPFPPPAGRRVRDQLGHVWVIDPTGDVAREDDRSIVLTWAQLIATGPLALVELTAQEKASEALYGPVGARWGIPGTPCVFDGCALDAGHADVHRDAAGNPLGVTTEATEPYGQPPAGTMLSRICTCGVVKHTALQHEPGCARYVTPRQDDTQPSALQPAGWEPAPDVVAVMRTADLGLTAAERLTSRPLVTGEPPAEVPPKPRATKRTSSAGSTANRPTGRKRTPRKAN